MVRSGFGWYKDANCKDSDPKIFMSHDKQTIETAKMFCQGCSVKSPCKKSYAKIDCVAGGQTLLERLKEKWKRIDNIGESNWK